nr:hypothetical protein [Tanacetum cinerariifolium]
HCALQNGLTSFSDIGITLVDEETGEEVVAMDAESQERLNQEDVNAASKGVSVVSAPELVSAVEPTIFDDEDTLFKPDKDVQEPKKKRVADETLLQESFKKLRAIEVSRSESTQEIPSNDPKEMTEEDVQNMLEIVPVPEFKVEALHVKYPIIDWEIHTKEKFSSAVPSEDKEKALWVELKRLFEPDADDVLWKLQIYMHAPLTWKFYSDCGVHHVSSTRGHDIFMLTEKDYPLSNAVMILILSGKLQVEEDNEMARDLVVKIFMEANKPRSRTKDNVVQRLKENAQRNSAAGLILLLLEVVLNGDSPPPTRIVDGSVQIVALTTAEQSGTSSESLDQIHDRLQKLISQLEILGETISQEDINLKFLRIYHQSEKLTL